VRFPWRHRSDVDGDLHGVKRADRFSGSERRQGERILVRRYDGCMGLLWLEFRLVLRGSGRRRRRVHSQIDGASEGRNASRTLSGQRGARRGGAPFRGHDTHPPHRSLRGRLSLLDRFDISPVEIVQILDRRVVAT
jgi:hypothetical protein